MHNKEFETTIFCLICFDFVSDWWASSAAVHLAREQETPTPQYLYYYYYHLTHFFWQYRHDTISWVSVFLHDALCDFLSISQMVLINHVIKWGCEEDYVLDTRNQWSNKDLTITPTWTFDKLSIELDHLTYLIVASNHQNWFDYHN